MCKTANHTMEKQKKIQRLKIYINNRGEISSYEPQEIGGKAIHNREPQSGE
jgi:hypothetical protein